MLSIQPNTYFTGIFAAGQPSAQLLQATQAGPSQTSLSQPQCSQQASLLITVPSFGQGAGVSHQLPFFGSPLSTQAKVASAAPQETRTSQAHGLKEASLLLKLRKIAPSSRVIRKHARHVAKPAKRVSTKSASSDSKSRLIVTIPCGPTRDTSERSSSDKVSQASSTRISIPLGGCSVPLTPVDTRYCSWNMASQQVAGLVR